MLQTESRSHGFEDMGACADQTTIYTFPISYYSDRNSHGDPLETPEYPVPQSSEPLDLSYTEIRNLNERVVLWTKRVLDNLTRSLHQQDNDRNGAMLEREIVKSKYRVMHVIRNPGRATVVTPPIDRTTNITELAHNSV